MKLKNQYVFNSITELARTLDKSEVISGRDNTSDARRSGRWSDTENYQEALDKMVNGYVYKDINKEVEDYRSIGTGSKSRSYQDVVGHQVIVPLYLQGIPTNMINKRRVIDNKIVTIIYEASVPHHVDSDDIKKVAKELFAKIVKLESEGYRCNVWIVETNVDDGGRYGFALKLKTDRETLSFKKMMFPLVSPSFLRRIGFRIKERLYKDWIGSGYGSARFDIDMIDKFIQKNLGVRKYELWNWEGKRN